MAPVERFIATFAMCLSLGNRLLAGWCKSTNIYPEAVVYLEPFQIRIRDEADFLSESGFAGFLNFQDSIFAKDKACLVSTFFPSSLLLLSS